MIYNEWAQLLETTDPNTGELFQADQFFVFDYNDLGTAMLQDALFARQSWLDEGNTEVAMRFLRASFQGGCTAATTRMTASSTPWTAAASWGRGHLAWMMNEINKLVWPAEGGIGTWTRGSWPRRWTPPARPGS